MLSKLFFSAMIIFSVLVISSCSKDKDGNDDLCSGLWTSEVADEANIFTTRLQEYGADQTPAKCSAAKAAGEDYVSALEKFDNCSGWTDQNRTQWQQTLTQLRASIADLCD